MGWFNLAVCLERLSAWDDASQAFHKACTLDPKHLDAHLGLGVCHLRLEDPKSALFSFERCLELAPDHEDALFGKAAALQSLGHPDEASAIYQQILERNPESEESLSNLVLIGMAKEDFDMVREYLRAAAGTAAGIHRGAGRPGRMGLRRRRARAHREVLHAAGVGGSGHISKAGSTWRWRIRSRAAGNRPPKPTRKRSSCARNPARRYTNLGIVREQLRRSGRRARRLRHAPSRRIPTRSRRSGIWRCCWSTPASPKRPSAGTSRCSKTPRKKKKRASAWATCACSARISAAPPEAFEGCLKYRPQWPEAHANLALAYSGLGERDHAERLYEKMLEADPKSMDALRGLAALAIQASDFDTALEFHVRLIDLGERSPEILYNAGLMYEKAGQLDKAVRLYRDALAQQPDMPEALLNLGRILEATGKSDEARACWSKALEAEPALAQGYFGPAID